MKRRTSYCWLIAACLLFSRTAALDAQQTRPALHQLLRGHVRTAVLSGKAAPVARLQANQNMHLSIVLPLRNQAELTSLLNRLYDSSSPDYHHFLSASQFTEQFAPTPEDYQAVVQFAQANGFTVGAAPANRMVVPISGSAAQVENAFHLKMGLYQHPTEHRLFFSPDREPSVDLAVPVAHVAGLNNFSTPQPMATHAAAQDVLANATASGSGPNGSFLASDMRAAYYGGTALTGAGQTVGLLEFDGYNPSDVDLTFTSAGQSNSVPVNNVLLDGVTGASASGDDSEEVLDIVQAIGMAPGLSQVRVYIGSNDAEILNAIASEDVAQQVSISWSWSPDDPATDEMFLQECAAQGQSVFAASGDWGQFDPYFDSFFPAEDAFVTAAGGTVLTVNGQAWESETAWNRSGGGVSPDGVSMPVWQAGIATSTNGGSTTLRNVPDVAAEANTDNYICSSSGCHSDWGGTSFSAPRWAGFMALVNQQAAQNGQPSIGFLNPILYALGTGSGYADAFHDVVLGNNDTRGNCCGWPYYNAVPGYDLVTGWGSPAGQALIDALAPATSGGFALSSSASTVTITPGGSASTTITITDKAGFSGNVNLTVSGLPEGISASWSQNPPPGKSVLTLTAASSLLRGSYLVTVAGVSGSETESATFALTVNAPGFSLAAAPASLKIYPGNSGSVTVLINGTAGFNGSVNLAVTSGLPTGMTASWVQNPATGTGALTLTASDSIPASTDAMLTITGTSGNETETTTLAVAVMPPLFYLNVTPYPSNIAQGGTVALTVSAVPVSRYSDTIKLTAPALPAGVTGSFSPSSITFGQTSTLTLTASSSAPVGAGLLGIQASGALAGTINQFNLAVTAKPQPSFGLTVAQASLPVAQGSSATDAITVTPQNGFSGSVNLAISSGLPNGITASFSQSSTTASSQLTIAANSTAAAGFYTLWITGTSGTQSTTAALFLSVTPPPSFALNAAPASINLVQGASTANAITVVPQAGFSGSVHLAVISALPAGVTASFSQSVTTASSTLALGASYTARAGNYAITVAGSSGDRTVTATIPLTIAAVPMMPTTVALSISPDGGTLTAGSPFTLTATVTTPGAAAPPTGNVVFTVGSISQTVALNASGVATYSGTVPTTPGSLAVSAAYQGGSGFAASASSSINEVVATPVPSQFALAASAVTIAPGATSGNASTITITPTGGFAGAVSLTAVLVSAPAGAKNLPTFSFGASSPVHLGSNGSATATLTISTASGSLAITSPARDASPWYTPGAAALGFVLLFGIPARRRAWRALLGMVVLLAVLTGGAVGCSSSFVPTGTSAASGNGTTPGLYTISVTGVSGATSATTNVSLTVE